MPDTDDVLAANEAFYRAFARRDQAAMVAVWSRAASIACVHPGWQPLRGQGPVMRSWRDILGGGGAPPAIRCSGASATVVGDVAIVICFEEVPGGRLVATNLFQREAGGWKMVHHHAGPATADGGSGDDPDEDPPASSGGGGGDDEGPPPGGLLN